MNFNIFHILADVTHTLSKIILIVSIHRNASAEGVSLLTQLLYIAVFCTRYLDLFWTPLKAELWVWWLFVLKLFYIASSFYIVYIMMRVFARTREKEYGWKLALYSLAGSLVSAPFVCLIFEHWINFRFFEVLWTFSVVLESVCVLPQLLLLRQTSVPTVINSYYLLFLGSYRAFYILNWFVVGFSSDPLRPDYWTSVVFGLLQTALYVDFAWVYYSRQRVKLRGGGIVDSDDLRSSYLVKNFIGRRNNHNGSEDDEDITDEDAALNAQENGVVRPPAPRSGRSWGARGISVSADDTLANHHDPDARMVDPAHFEDDEDEADAPPPPPPAKDTQKAAPEVDDDEEADAHEAANAVGSSATEWQNDGAK